MNILNTKAGQALALAVVAGVAVWFITRKLGAVAEEAVAAVNPLSDKNLAYRGVSAVGSALSGDKSWSLGSWLYDRFNPPYDPNAQPLESRQTAQRREAAIYSGVAPK